MQHNKERPLLRSYNQITVGENIGCAIPCGGTIKVATKRCDYPKFEFLKAPNLTQASSSSPPKLSRIVR